MTSIEDALSASRPRTEQAARMREKRVQALLGSPLVEAIALAVVAELQRDDDERDEGAP